MMSTPRKGGAARQSMTPSKIPPSVRTPMRIRGTPSKNKIVTNEKGEEGITVAIRMRPLNTRESSERRTWRVLPQFNSVTQTTSNGQPLPERVMNRTFFTFDKTFGEDTTTRQIYDGVAKGIVDSVVSGLNGTIFAYGQTSSGKTFTMQGSGSIEEGSVNGGGVVHMAAHDIFSYISNTTDRVFLVRASFVEIYNEEVRDLLSENSILQVREDPQRGVFVNSEEVIATDFSSLLEILFSGEKNRAVAATGMNERSSRSHTIFRITIESRLKGNENDPDVANVPEGEGAVRISTLNLVDLAGSESVRHTGNTGDRLKEGAKINQSLLTLSRVIVGLGQPNQTHINFRDSKLTRILQPSLSGNARMAVVCCATPSELYLEETRSTLQFASRAKLVKTNAKVNEVIDDRSLIRRLQRELMEAKKSSGGTNQSAQLLALETEAANAGKERKEAEDKLRRLQKSILNSSGLFDSSRGKEVSSDTGTQAASQRKRRLSDGGLKLKSIYETPVKHHRFPAPKSAGGGKEQKKLVRLVELPAEAELQLVRHAVATKGAQKRKLQEEMINKSRIIETTESSLQEVTDEKDGLLQALDTSEVERQQLLATVIELRRQLKLVGTDKEKSLELLDAELKAKEDVERELDAWKQHSKQIISGLEVQKVQLKDSLSSLEEEKDCELNDVIAEKDDLAVHTTELEQQLDQAKKGEKGQSVENVRIAFELAQLVAEKEKILNERDADKQKMQTLSGEIALLMGTMQDAADEKQHLKAQFGSLQKNLEAEVTAKQNAVEENAALKDRLKGTEAELQHANASVTSVEQHMNNMREEKQAMNESKKDLILSHETTLQERDSQIAAQKHEINDLSSCLQNEKAQVESSNNETTQLQMSLADTEISARELEEKLATMTAEKEAASEEIQELQCSLDDFEKCLEDVTGRATTLEEEKDDLLERIEDLIRERDAANTATTTLQSKLTSMTSNRDDLTTSLQMVQSDLSESRTTIENLESRMMVLRADLQLESSKFEEEKYGLSNKVDHLRKELDKISNLHSDSLSTLSEMQHECQTRGANISNLEEERQKMNSELEDKADQVVSLSTTRNEQGGVIIKLHEEIQALTKSMDEVNDAAKERELELNETLEQKDAEVVELRFDIEAKEEVISTSDTTMLDLQEQLAKAEMKSTKLVSAIEEKTNELDAMKADAEVSVDLIHSEAIALKEALLNREGAISLCEETVSGLQEQLSLKEVTESQQRVTIEQLTTERDATKGELEASLDSTNAEIVALKEKSCTQENMVVEYEESISKLNYLLSQADTKSTDQTETLQRLISEQDATKASLKTTIEHTSAELLELKAAAHSEKERLLSESETIASEFQKQIAQAVSKSQAQTDAIDDINNMNAGIKSELEETTKRMATKISELNTVVAEKEEVISESSSTISELQEILAQAEALSLQKNAAIELRDTTMTDLEQTVEQLTTEISELYTAVTGKEAAISESNSTIFDLQERLTQTETLSSEKSAAIEERDTTKDDLEQVVELMTAEVNELNALVVDKGAVISESSSTIADLQEQLSQAKIVSSTTIEERDAAKADLGQTVERMTTEISELNAFVIEQEGAITESNSTIAALQDRLAQAQTLSSVAIEARDAAKAVVDQTVEEMTIEISELNAFVIEQESVVAESSSTIVALQDQLAQAETVSSATIEERNAAKAEVDQTVEQMTTEISELNAFVIEQEVVVTESNSTIVALQDQLAQDKTVSLATIEERDAAKAEVDQTVELMAKEISGLNAFVIEQEGAITVTNSTIIDLQDRLTQAETLSSAMIEARETAKAEVDQMVERMTTKISELNTFVIEQEGVVTESTSRISALQDRLAQVETLSSATIEERDAAKVEVEQTVERMTTEINELNNVVTEKEENITESNSTIVALQDQLAQAETVSSATIEERDAIKNEVDQTVENMTKEISELNAFVIEQEVIVTESTSTIAALQDRLAQAETLSLEKNAAIEDRDATKADLEQRLEQIITEINQLNTVLVEKDEIITESNSAVAALQQRLTHAETISSANIEERDSNQADLEQTVERMTKEIVELNVFVIEQESGISKSNTTITDLQERLAQAQILSSANIEERDTAKAEIDKLVELTSSQTSKLNAFVIEQEVVVTESNSTIAALQDRLAQVEALSSATIEKGHAAKTDLEQTVGRMTTEINELNNVVTKKEEIITGSNNKIAALLERLTLAETLSSVTMEEQYTTKTDLEQTVERMATKISELNTVMTEKEKVIFEFNTTVVDLQERLMQAETMLSEKSAAIEAVTQRREAIQLDLEAALDAKRELSEESYFVKESLSSLLGEKQILTEKLLVAESNAENTEHSNCDEKKELLKVVSSLEAEKCELAQLLSSANESVKEARQAALVADDELDLKEQKLEATLNQLSVLEQEIIVRTDQLQQLEERLSISLQAKDNDDLLIQIEELSQERIKTEETLAKEREERKQWEDRHKQRMGEEQRALIQEAENEMSSLRTERDQVKSALRQSETDVYTVKQENDELVDESKRLESKVMESQKSASSMEQELSQLKSANFDLNIEKKDLSGKIKSFRKERGVQDHKTTEEIVKVTAELNHIKAENYEVRQQCLDLEEIVKNLERQCEKTHDESQIDRKRRLELESILPGLEVEVQKLREKVREKDNSDRAQAIANKENDVDAVTLKNLREEVKDMKKEIKTKDVRIKKLQSVSLTKEQCTALKKIKEERVQFKEENESYRKKLAETEREVAVLHSQGTSSKIGKQAGQDLATLRFEKEALETKLRKYLAYCKALESDKNHIIDSLRARKRAVVDDDFAGAVVSLCDQLTSLEEECDALSNAEGRASSYLVEMERLRQRISSLQSETDESQNKVTKLARTEAELTTKLKRVEEKSASLREDRDKLRKRSAVSNREAEPEKSRQVKYLEQENLQLMLELKTSKKQLQSTRSELDVLRMKALDDDTEDFTSFIAPQGQPSDARSSDMHSKSSQGSHSTSSPVEDKENRVVSTERSGKTSAQETPKKSRFTRSKSKSTRMRESNSRSVGLGDAGVDENNTEECRQS